MGAMIYPMSSETHQSSARLLERHWVAATPARVAVLNALLRSATRHLSAEQLCASMLESGELSGVSTLKNAVYELASLGVLARVLVQERNNRTQTFYELADQSFHRHLYCVRCGSIDEILDETFEKALLEHFQAHGLKPANVDLAMVGTCAGCNGPR